MTDVKRYSLGDFASTINECRQYGRLEIAAG
jgi:hypothetical protein